MAKAISIHVGINQVTSTVFQAEPLHCCENDAKAMFDLACAPQGAGFQPGWTSPVTGQGAPMLGSEATFEAVDEAIKKAADDLEPGGVFLFTFAGHGKTKILEPEEAETDGTNEYIVLVDHLMLDNHWRNELWPRFNNKNVRAIVIADCCHAAGAFNSLVFGVSLEKMVKSIKQFLAPVARFLGLDGSEAAPVAAGPTRVRRVKDEELEKEFNAFKEFYDKQLAEPSSLEGITTNRLLLAACGANEDALEGEKFGAFTEALLTVWNNKEFEGDYHKFINDIRSAIKNTTQTPILVREGEPDFTTQRPFQI